ncbi:MAG: hypothetical protein QNJ20_13355 [Paracoccaceae bacterium]|nr:hypothetical protein [Paracoccaceae bacterium]
MEKKLFAAFVINERHCAEFCGLGDLDRIVPPFRFSKQSAANLQLGFRRFRFVRVTANAKFAAPPNTSIRRCQGLLRKQ